jgi:predicted enzyme related to lactoylglutathione lyase
MENKPLPQGHFCWVDVAVPNPAETHTFFSELFGWGRRVRPTEEAQAYSIMTLEGHHIAGVCEVEGSETSRWMNYLLVDDLAAATAKAESLGGEILKRDLEIATFGVMTVVQDPTGAIFSLWESKRGERKLPHRHGTVCWNELVTKDLDKAKAFYSKLAGWTHRETRFGDLCYTIFEKDGDDACGAMSLSDAANDKSVSNWIVYFTVDNCEESTRLCQELGGTVGQAPFEVEGLGRCALLSDPSGGTFGILEFV